MSTRAFATEARFSTRNSAQHTELVTHTQWWGTFSFSCKLIHTRAILTTLTSLGIALALKCLKSEHQSPRNRFRFLRFSQTALPSSGWQIGGYRNRNILSILQTSAQVRTFTHTNCVKIQNEVGDATQQGVKKIQMIMCDCDVWFRCTLPGWTMSKLQRMTFERCFAFANSYSNSYWPVRKCLL